MILLSGVPVSSRHRRPATTRPRGGPSSTCRPAKYPTSTRQESCAWLAASRGDVAAERAALSVLVSTGDHGDTLISTGLLAAAGAGADQEPRGSAETSRSFGCEERHPRCRSA